MLTMPRWKLHTMRWLTNVMLDVVGRWEDKHANRDDYRMREATGGLWQASQAFKAILDGDFNELRPIAEQMEAEAGEGEVKRILGEKYVAELIENAAVPLFPRTVNPKGGPAT